MAKKLLFPPLPLQILLVLLAAAALIYSFTGPDVHPAAAYGSYVFSFYALVTACARIPAMIRMIRRFRRENPVLRRCGEDVRLRAKISLYSSVAFNSGYCVLQLCLGIYHSSIWFYTFAVYYFLLALMRFFLAKETARSCPGADRFRELLIYRFCGILMQLMNGALAVIVAFIVWQGRTFRHHEITTIAMAAYTFTALTLAIVNLVKYRKFQSPVLSASKAISLAAASVSMLTLETAMLTAFGGDNSPEFRRIMTAATGTAVCAFELGLSAAMIIRSTREIRKLRKEKIHG